MRSPQKSLPHCLSALALLFLLFISSSASSTIENTSVQRTVDLTSQLVRDSSMVAITNLGDSPVSTYDFPIENYENLSFFEAQSKKGSKRLDHTISKKGEHHVATITFEEPLAAKDKKTLVISSIFTHAVSPFPKEVAQNEKQKMRFIGNVQYFSSYPSAKVKTTFLFPDGDVAYQGEGLTKSENKITYGPVTATVEPFARHPLTAHYTNNARFLTTERLVRTLEVSHWGNNLAVEEFYDVVHSGAKLKGHYSRLDFDRFQHSHANTQVVKGISLTLPVGATDVYYRDVIGNISTSHFRSSPFDANLELTPRYPLFGGWKTKWFHGYNLPLANALESTADGTYALNFMFVAPYEDAVIDDLLITVTLPEGATDIKFRSDIDLGVTVELDVASTYLDTTGRPVLKISRKNVVADHKIPVQVSYRFTTVTMFHEPLLLMSFFFALFVASIFLVRLDLSISKDPEVEKEENARSLWLDLTEKEEARKDLFKQLESAVEKHKSDKKEDALNAKKKTIEAELTDLNKDVSSIQVALRPISQPRAQKIDELLRLSTEKFGKIVQGKKDEVAKIDAKVEEVLSAF